MQPRNKQEAEAIGSSTYFDGKPCIRGHLSLRQTRTGNCRQCQKESTQAWRDANRHIHNARAAEYREKNRSEIRKRDAAARDANREHFRKSKSEWYSNNKDAVQQRRRERRECDPVFAMADRLRCRFKKFLVLRGFKKATKTHSILGCTYEEFVSHIERQFLKGMTWDNKCLWHIDHITPLCTAKTEDEVIALFHFTNLRPIWAKDNLQKSGKELFLI